MNITKTVFDFAPSREMANLFKFYFDVLSPLSRPLLVLFEHANVRCEKIQVALRKGEDELIQQSFSEWIQLAEKLFLLIFRRALDGGLWKGRE